MKRIGWYSSVSSCPLPEKDTSCGVAQEKQGPSGQGLWVMSEMTHSGTLGDEPAVSSRMTLAIRPEGLGT